MSSNLSISYLNTRMVKMIEYDPKLLRLQITEHENTNKQTHIETRTQLA